MNARPLADLLDDLTWRELVADRTKPEELHRHLLRAPRAAYVGFDPTADSLHIGSLLPLLALRRVQRAGHRPIVLIGGGTGLIGDPSGKAGERQLNPEDQVAAWADRLKTQVQRFLDFDHAILVDNYEWLSKIQVIAFLRDIGKHFPLGAMLARESVRTRMHRSGDGISYTEFSYQVLQAYDFLSLHERHGCTVQMGGSDQWGNITAGTELIQVRSDLQRWKQQIVELRERLGSAEKDNLETLQSIVNALERLMERKRPSEEPPETSEGELPKLPRPRRN